MATLRVRAKKFIVRKVSTKRRPFPKPRIKPVKKVLTLCEGGPFAGKKITTSEDAPGTYPFRVGDMRGQYVAANGRLVWKPAVELDTPQPTRKARKH